MMSAKKRKKKRVKCLLCGAKTRKLKTLNGKSNINKSDGALLLATCRKVKHASTPMPNPLPTRIIGPPLSFRAFSPKYSKLLVPRFGGSEWTRC